MFGSTRSISRVASTTTPTAPSPSDTTTTLPRGSRPPSAAIPSNARSDTSGSRRSRSVMTPSTAVSGRGSVEIWSGSGTISRTRSSGSAYSCSPRRKLNSEISAWAGAAAELPIATGDRLAVRVVETPSRANCPLSSRDGFNNLIVLWPSEPLMVPSSSAGSVVPAPASSCSSSLRGKRQQAVDPIDDKADRGIAAHDDHTGLLIGFNARQLQQRPQADDRQDNPAQIGEPEQARRNQRHMGQIRQPDDFGDGGKPQRERFSGKLENQEIFGGDDPPLPQQAGQRPPEDRPFCGAAGVYWPSRR